MTNVFFFGFFFAGTNIQETLHILNHDIYNSRLFDEEHNRLAAEEFTRQHNIRLRELRQRQQQQRQQQQQPQQQPQPQPQPQPQQQQQQPLPDLVQSAEVTEARRKPAEDGRLKPITLQVEVCPKCYENGKLKVISVTNPLANNGDIAQQINRTVEHQSHHNHVSNKFTDFFFLGAKTPIPIFSRKIISRKKKIRKIITICQFSV